MRRAHHDNGLAGALALGASLGLLLLPERLKAQTPADAGTTVSNRISGPQISADPTLPLEPLAPLFRKQPHAVVVRFSKPPEPTLVMATISAHPPHALLSRLSHPHTLKEALPALIRAEPTSAQSGASGSSQLSEKTNWELEIPLWNLKGTLWLKRFPGTVQLLLTDGAFSPGRFDIQIRKWGTGSLVTLRGQANIGNGNWATRRIAQRDPLAAPALNAAAALTLLRAVALLPSAGTNPPGASPPRTRQPRADLIAALRHPEPPPQAPAFREIDTESLLALARATETEKAASSRGLEESARPLALVISAPTGRLQTAQIALRVPQPAAELRANLLKPELWQAVPGWDRIRPSETRRGLRSLRVRWAVDGGFPFISVQGIWDIVSGKNIWARMDEGDRSGALWAWHFGAPVAALSAEEASETPAEEPSGCFAVYSTHPNLHRAGYLPRKFIEAEPLLEHGMALAHGYTHAISLLRAALPATP